MLDMEFQRSENALTRGVQREQIAASERQSAASLGVQERLGELSAETSRSNALLAADVNREELAGRKELTQLQIDASKELQQLAAELAQRLNTKLVQYTTKDGKSIVRLEAPDGTPMEQPKDKDGNELTFVTTADDTPEMKNMKSLMALGVTQERAMSTIFDAKNANRELAQAGIFKAITDGMSTMKNLQEADFDFAQRKAKDITDGIYGVEEAPAAPTGEAPAPSSSTEEKRLTPAQKQKAIKDAKLAVKPKSEGGLGKDVKAVQQWLEDQGITPAEAGIF